MLFTEDVSQALIFSLKLSDPRKSESMEVTKLVSQYSIGPYTLLAVIRSDIHSRTAFRILLSLILNVLALLAALVVAASMKIGTKADQMQRNKAALAPLILNLIRDTMSLDMQTTSSPLIFPKFCETMGWREDAELSSTGRLQNSSEKVREVIIKIFESSCHESMFESRKGRHPRAWSSRDSTKIIGEAGRKNKYLQVLLKQHDGWEVLKINSKTVV